MFKLKNMATVRELQKRYENKGWKFTFVYSSATLHLKKAPVIVTKGNIRIKGTSLTDIFKKL